MSSKKEFHPAHRDGRDLKWSFLFRLMLLVSGFGVLALLAWNLVQLLLLAFFALLVSIFIRSLSNVIAHHSPLPSSLSLALAVVALFTLFSAFLMLLGSTVQAQFNQLWEIAPDIVAALAERFGIENPEKALADQLDKVLEETSLVARFAGLSSTALGAVTNLLLVLVAGIYLAADPGTYRKGFLLLFPVSSRSEASETIDVIFASLRLWLVGQLLGMLLVGVLSATGLWLLGMPSALALGVIAGLFEFVPIMGPFIAAVPAVATGFAQSQEMGFWVIAIYVLIQQIEGNLITPLIQQRMVKVPPALTLFAVVAFALMFGVLGAIGAMPLLVVLFVVIKKVWIKETLDEEIHLPGEAEDGPTPNKAAPAITPD